jgi:hypothetical protein
MNILVPTEDLCRITILQRYGIDYTVRANSTLNQKFDILPNAVIPSGKYPISQFVAVGNGAHSASLGPGPTLFDHVARYKSLYNLLPIVLRELDNDLTPLQRENYALRSIETYGGVDYVAYRLKRISPLSLSPVQEIREIDPDTNELVTSEVYTPTGPDLSPPTPSAVGSPTTTNQYIGTFLDVEIVFDAFDITEFANACTIIYGNADNAVISEIGIVSGINRTITITEYDGVTQNDFVEATAACVTEYMTYYSLMRPPSTELRIPIGMAVAVPLVDVTA